MAVIGNVLTNLSEVLTHSKPIRVFFTRFSYIFQLSPTKQGTSLWLEQTNKQTTAINRKTQLKLIRQTRMFLQKASQPICEDTEAKKKELCTAPTYSITNILPQ